MFVVLVGFELLCFDVDWGVLMVEIIDVVGMWFGVCVMFFLFVMCDGRGQDGEIMLVYWVLWMFFVFFMEELEMDVVGWILFGMDGVRWIMMERFEE